MQNGLFDSLQSVEFMKSIKKGEKFACPCCGRWAQVYRRTLHHTTAWQLIRLYKMNGFGEYINAVELIPEGQQGVGDFTKAKYWDLIERRPLNEEETRLKSSGFWRLTEKGVAFVLSQSTIQKTALIFDDNVIGFDGPQVTITESLCQQFDYERLMTA